MPAAVISSVDDSVATIYQKVQTTDDNVEAHVRVSPIFKPLHVPQVEMIEHLMYNSSILLKLHRFPIFTISET